jgi:hypothetical protein
MLNYLILSLHKIYVGKVVLIFFTYENGFGYNRLFLSKWDIYDEERR